MGQCFSSSRGQSNPSPVVQEYGSGSTADLRSLSDARSERLDAMVGRHNGQTIQVSARTFDMMKKAHEVLQEVGYHTFPDGPGNQEEAIWKSHGRSMGRMLMTRSEGFNYPLFSSEFISQIKNAGGGNCLEYSRVTLMELFSRRPTMPLFDVREANMDHHYVVIGDWRDRIMGDQAIVVDAWQGLKKVHTYGERINSEAPIVRNVIQPADQMPPISDDMRSALSKTPVPGAQINAVLEHHTNTEVSEEGAKQLIQALRERGGAWRSITSANNLFTSYQSPDGDRSEFNRTPRHYLKSYLTAREQIDAEIPR